MNPDKTQVIWLGTWQQLVAFLITSVRLHYSTTDVPSTSVHNLDVLCINEM